MGNCVYQMSKLTSFVENLNFVNTLNVQNCVISTGNCVHQEFKRASQTHVLRLLCFFFVFFFFFELIYLTFPVNSARCALFTDPQILLFSNFFIKNGSHGTIYIFKNYFATIFFSFQFQFLLFNYIQTDPRCTNCIDLQKI